MVDFFSKLSLSAAHRTTWVFGAGASVPYEVPPQRLVLKRFAEMGRPGGDQAQRSFEDLRGCVRAHCAQVFPGLPMEDPRVSLEEVRCVRDRRDDQRSSRSQSAKAVAALNDLILALRAGTSIFGRGDAREWMTHERGGTPSPYAELLERAPTGRRR